MTLLNVEPAVVRGELKLYSCPKNYCQQVEWFLSDLLKIDFDIKWNPQPIAPKTMSMHLEWIGPVGLGSRIVSTLSKWPNIRLEVLQKNFMDLPAERYAHCPNLGIFRAEMNSMGETIITESRIKAALDRSQIENEQFEIELAFLLGVPWDDDLEPFRSSYVNSNLYWINKTG